MRNGLCVVTFFLAPAAEGDGGFACIPGTHKSNFLTGIPREVMRFVSVHVRALSVQRKNSEQLSGPTLSVSFPVS